MLKLISVHPQHPDWKTFLQLSIDYLLKYWPEAAENLSQDAFQQNYEETLKNQLALGNRGLFLLQNHDEAIGLCNVYLEDASMFIAEFYIKEEHQRKGYGAKMLQLLIEWATSKHAKQLIIEVDKNLINANQFWSTFQELSLDDSGARNRYHTQMTPS